MFRSMLIAVATLIVMLPASAGAAGAPDGKAVWDKTCAGCHAMMPPKFGDKAAWAPFVKSGVDAVTATIVKGKGMKRPMGGAKSEAEVRAAVEYILGQMK